MKAVTWCGKFSVHVENVPDPKILNPRDAVVRITTTAICGSDLHLYDGYVPGMKRGDILGHEFMGEIVEIGPSVKNLKVGDRVVVPFTISCGKCFFCQRQMFSCCDNSNPDARAIEKAYGFSPAGIYGYSHLFGGYAGGQAEYARVPFADVGPIKIPDGIDDEKVIFLSDIFPTGYQAAENCNIQGGDTVAVWGCGPVGQFAIRSAYLLGAEKVVAIDGVPERLRMAEDGKAISINMNDEYIYDRLLDLTGGRGPDACIEAVGMESHGATLDAWYDRLKVAAYMTTDRLHSLRQAINCCRKGGTVSVPGVYGGYPDKFPLGAAFNKALTFKMGQTHVQKHMPKLLERIERGEIDPSFVITHRFPLDQAPHAYSIFKNKQDRCIKVVMKPGQYAA